MIEMRQSRRRCPVEDQRHARPKVAPPLLRAVAGVSPAGAVAPASDESWSPEPTARQPLLPRRRSEPHQVPDDPVTKAQTTTVVPHVRDVPPATEHSPRGLPAASRGSENAREHRSSHSTLPDSREGASLRSVGMGVARHGRCLTPGASCCRPSRSRLVTTGRNRCFYSNRRIEARSEVELTATSRPIRDRLTCLATDQRSARAHRERPRPRSRVRAPPPQEGRQAPRGRDGPLGLGALFRCAGYADGGLKLLAGCGDPGFEVGIIRAL